MKISILILFFPVFMFGQTSISDVDIQVCTQLTMVKIDSIDKQNFEINMRNISNLALANELSEDFDWLVYKSNTHEYLIINFSETPQNALKITNYIEEFDKNNKNEYFLEILDSLSKLNIMIQFNYAKEMILPWSTVEAISVSEFPFAKMIEYKLSIDKIDEFDKDLRKLVKLLKKSNYPYPLEGSRGSIGAYGKIILVWFHNDWSLFNQEFELRKWIEGKPDFKELNEILNRIENLTVHKEVFNLDYIKEMSF